MPEAQIQTATAVRRARIPERELDSCVEGAVERSTRHLLSLQAGDGYWWGELEADTTLESDHILLHYLRRDIENDKVRKLANYLRKKQLPEGGWNIYPGGPAELNTSVKAYFALRLAGDAASRRIMERARKKIHEIGGLEVYQFVRSVLSGDDRCDRLGHGAGDSSRADAAAELVLRESVRDVVLDARDCRSLDDHLRPQA